MDAETARARRDDFFLLDVREPDEWQAGHMTGSYHIPMRELGARQAELPQDRPILCICRSGNRSGTVTRSLAEAGYQVENLDGGLQQWESLGYDLETPDGDQGTVI